MPLGYRQVKDLYDTLHDAGVVTKSLPEWSQEMNESLGTDLYSAGQEDNWIKRTSVGIDRLLEKTGIPQAGEELGRTVGEVVGNPEAGAAIGGGMARMGVNMLPMLIPGPGWIGAAGMAALSGAEAYTSTGSPTAGVIGGLTAGIMPTAANLAEQAVLKRMGGELVEGAFMRGTPTEQLAKLAAGAKLEEVSKYFPKTIPQGIASQAAGQLAAGGLGVGADIAQQVAAGQPVSVSPTEQLLNLTLGQLPFAGAYLTKGGRVPWGGAATRSHIAELESAIEKTRGLTTYNENKQETANKAGMENVVDPPPSEPADNVNAEINQIRVATRGLQEEGSTLGQEKQEKLGAEENLLVDLQGAQPGNILGAQIMPDTERTELIGTVVEERPGWRMIRVSDDPRNGEHAGKQIGFFTKDEPGLRPGDTPETQVFGVPQGHWSEYYNKELSSAAGDLVPTGEFDAGRALTEADQALDAAKSGADMQGAVVKLNGVRAHFGEAPLDDVELQRILEDRQVGDTRAAIKAAINDTRRMVDGDAEAANVDKLIVEREQVRRDLETAPDEVRGDLEAQLDDLNVRIGKADEPPVRYKLSEQSKRIAAEFPGLHETLVPVTVDIAKLDEAHGKAFPKERVGPAGKGGVPGRYERFAKWVESGQPMEMPIVNFDKEGQPQFIRGRHRFAVLRDKGQKTIEVTVPRDQAESILQRFGTKGRPEEAVGRDIKADLEKVGTVPPESSPETAPLNQVILDKLARITWNTPHKNDRAMMFDFVRRGQQAFMEKHGMNADELGRWTAQNHVASWIGKLADSIDVPRTPPTRKIETEKLFTPENDVDMEFMRKVGTNGRELVNYLRGSQDPVLRALGEDLGRHEAALGLIDVSVRDMDGTSYTQMGKEGRSHLKFSAELRHEGPLEQDRIMMHELLHGLTLHELHNPANAKHVTALDALRQKVIDSLPKNLRDVHAQVQNEGWYQRWEAGNAKWDDFKDRLENVDDMHTIYGLLNNDEFISQGLTVPEFREKLAGIKGADGVNLYTRFVEWIKNVLGLRAEGSVLEGLMYHTDELIGTGNYMATTREYGQRYFENQGLSPKQATKQTERAIALIRGGDKDALARMALARVDSPELRKTERGMRELLKRDPAPTVAVLSEIKYPPTEAGINQFATDLVLGRAEGGAEALRVMDPKVSAYVYAKVRDLQSLLGMVDNVTRPEVAGKVAIEEPGKARAFAVEYLDNANKAMGHEEQFIRDTADVQGLEAMSPMGFLDAEMKRRAPNVADPPEVDTPEKKLSWLEGKFANPNYVAKASAEAAEFVSRGYMLEPNEKKMKLSALQALGIDENGNFNKELLKPFSDPQIVRAADRWLYWNYQKGKEKGITMLGRDDADVRRELSSVPEGKRKAVENMVVGLTQAGQQIQVSILNKMTDIAILNGAIKIAPITKLKVAQNMEISKRMLDIQTSDWSNPQVAVENQARLAALQQELGAAFDPLLQFAKNEAAILKKQGEFNAANPAYTTMRKYGAYEVEYRKGNKTFVDRVGNEKEAKALVAERGGQLLRLERTQDTVDTGVMFGMPELQGLQSNRQLLMKDVLGPEAIDEMGRHALIETPGLEDVSFVRNQVSWIDQASKYWTRELFRTQKRAMLTEPELMQRPDVQKMLATHADNMLNPDPVAASEIRRVLSTWYLSTPATAMVNGAQLLVRGATEMTSLTGKPIDSFRRIINASKEALGLSKPPAELAKEREWLNRQIKDEGLVSAFNEGDPANDGMEALQQALSRGKPKTLGQQLSERHMGLNRKVLWMFQQVEKFNNKGAITAAFDYHMEEGGVRKLTGKAYEDARQVAYEKAKGFNQTVNDPGGKANRPIWWFSGRDPFSRSAGVLTMSMQTYTMGTINQLANYIKKGFYDPPGLKPGEKYNARIALVQLLAVQTAFAGIVGVPGASAGLSLINQAFPELEVNKNLRKWTNLIFSGDEENGNVISDVAMNGIPSMFGWDMQSRLSMGNLLPGVSEFNGFQSENLAGPAVNLAGTLFKGVGQVIGGEPREAFLTLLPPVAKKFITWAADGFMVRDFNNKPVLDPTGGEVVGMALGFQPTRLTEWNKTQRIALSAQKMEQERKKVFTQDLANQLMKGRFGDVKQILREKLEKEPETFDWEATARSAARAATELQFPRDLRREGSGSREYARALRVFGLDPSLPSEVARKQFEIRVLQGLGIRTDAKSMRRAMEMDALRMQNPKLTRYELNRLADADERQRKNEALSAVAAGSPL